MLFILDGGSDDRAILDKELNHPAKAVLLILGDGPGRGSFVQNAAQVTAAFPWRTVIWAKDDAVLSAAERQAFFGSAASAAAVLLDRDDKVAGHLSGTESAFAIDRAFRQAQA